MAIARNEQKKTGTVVRGTPVQRPEAKSVDQGRHRWRRRVLLLVGAVVLVAVGVSA